MQKRERLFYIENLRSFIIMLVVLQHLAVTYCGFGAWYMHEGKAISLAEHMFFSFNLSYFQGFFMGILFLISGYFAYGSYSRKGFKGFVLERLKRLGIPALIFMLIIHPLILYFQLNGPTWMNPAPASFWDYYSKYIISFNFFSGTGPLWFAVALLIFSLIYALIRLIFGSRPAVDGKKPLFRSINMIGLILLIAALAFVIRIYYPIGSPAVMNMQLYYFASYIVLFIVGIIAGKRNEFEKTGYRMGSRWLIATIFGGFFLWVIITYLGKAFPGPYLLGGRGTWQSAAFAVWESFIGVGMSVGLITFFREKFNSQTKLQKAFSDSAFTVFMFHTPIIVQAAKFALPLNLPPLIKYMFMGVICVPACFAIAHFIIRRIPLLNKVL